MIRWAADIFFFLFLLSAEKLPTFVKKWNTLFIQFSTSAHMSSPTPSQFFFIFRERSGSVVECLTRDRRATGSSLTGIIVLCPWARHINPSLVQVQPRKTRPFITERLLMGLVESNQTNKLTVFFKERSVYNLTVCQLQKKMHLKMSSAEVVCCI